MGFTRYFKLTGETFDDYVLETVKDVIAKAKTLYDIDIFGPDGYGEPIVTPELIAFNGDSSKSLDCESFYAEALDINRNFCKTGRQPYDIVVNAVCKILKYYNGVSLSNDGENEEEKADELIKVCIDDSEKELDKIKNYGLDLDNEIIKNRLLELPIALLDVSEDNAINLADLLSNLSDFDFDSLVNYYESTYDLLEFLSNKLEIVVDSDEFYINYLDELHPGFRDILEEEYYISIDGYKFLTNNYDYIELSDSYIVNLNS